MEKVLKLESGKNSLQVLSACFIITVMSFFVLSNLAGFYNSFLFLIAGLISLFVSFMSPRGGILALVFLTMIFERFFTLQPLVLGRIEYKIYPVDLVLLGIIAGIVFQFLWQGADRFLGGTKIKTPDICLLILIFLSFLYFAASFFNPLSNWQLAFSSFKQYAFYPLVYFAILSVFRERSSLKDFFRFALAGAVCLIFFVFYGLAAGQGLWSQYTPLSTEGVRALAFTHGFYLSLAFLGLLIYLIFHQKEENLDGRQKNLNVFFWWTVLAIWLVGIIGSMMRHLWGGIAIALFFAYWLLPNQFRKNFHRLILHCGLILLVIAILLFYFSALFPSAEWKKEVASVSQVIQSRVFSLLQVQSDESFFWRSVAWKNALAEYWKNPFLGLGLGRTFLVEIEKYREYTPARNIHNSPLVLLIQFGLLGLILFGLMVFSLLKAVLKKVSQGWTAVFLPTLLIFYLFLFLFQPYLETNMLGILFWIILGLNRIKAYENIGN